MISSLTETVLPGNLTAHSGLHDLYMQALPPPRWRQAPVCEWVRHVSCEAAARDVLALSFYLDPGAPPTVEALAEPCLFLRSSCDRGQGWDLHAYVQGSSLPGRFDART